MSGMPVEPTLKATPPKSEPSGASAGALVAILLIGLMMTGLAVILFPALWFVEQLTIIQGETIGRASWLGGLATLAVVVGLPALLAQAAADSERVKSVYQAWAWAALFILLMMPAQLAPPNAQQSAAVLQIAGCAVFVVLLRWRGHGEAVASRGTAWPLVWAALIGWPWVIWGALGSWLDTALNLAAALVFGLAAARLIAHFHAPMGEERPLPFGIRGFVAGATLLVMGAAFGHNGQQVILIFLLGSLGWLAAAMFGGRAGAAGMGRPWLLVGLVAAAPLLFHDPEELSLLLNLGSRDVGYYALYATLIGSVSALVLGVAVWLLGRAAGERRALGPVGAAVALAGLLAAYFLVGQPGWHGERLYVVLSEQADLSAAASVDDPVERRTAVYRALVSHADTTQAGLRQVLDRIGVDYRPYYLVNALEVDAGPLMRLWLQSRPEVDRVLDSPELRPLPALPSMALGTADAPTEPQWNLTDIGAPRVWADFGALGEGIVVGQSDSGVDGEHPELSEQYRGNQTDGDAPDAYNWLDPWYATTTPTDIGGHGTHTLGSALGRTVGVAPEASWIGCVNLGRNLGNAPRYLDCLQFMLAPHPQGGDALADGRPELGAHVLNNSWGCPEELEGCDAGALLPAAQGLRAAGVFVVASAGNDGDSCETIRSPLSLYAEVFTVGAADADGGIAPFSSRGPVTADSSGRTKPDVVAPGVDVLSAYPGGTYEYASGTSMAGPQVAGVVALLWSADPSLVGDIERTERILTQTAKPVAPEGWNTTECSTAGFDTPDNGAGYGMIDAYAAVELALSERE